MSTVNPKMIAFYLPQYYPIPENDEWYGKGFTEWTNVAKAKKLYPGHYQPHVPADLGFYDLRVKETRQAQAKMAERYGIAAFCYWNYWFGKKKQILDMPIWEVFKDKEIHLPFCLAWANHSWEKKMWSKERENILLIKQEYLGEDDYTEYFYTILPLLKDNRYLRINGKLFFVVYNPIENNDIRVFINTWRTLAEKEQIGKFYFVGKDSGNKNREQILAMGFDAVYEDDTLNIHHEQSVIQKCIQYIGRKFLGFPTVFQYRNAIKHMVKDYTKLNGVIPTIAPNWDHSPRSGRNCVILDNCKPKYFESLVRRSIAVVSEKPTEEQVVMIKSWNEWGEGNHLEPDLLFGYGYLNAIRKAVSGIM